MFQKNAYEKTSERCDKGVEERLAAYYGPALPPHPLPEAVWVQLRAQIEAARRVPGRRSRTRWPGYVRPKRRQTVPLSLQEVFATLLAQTNYRRPQPELSCHFTPRLSQPRVQTSPLGRGQIRLVLPEQSWQGLQTLELEVLLAAGLARCAVASRPFFLLARVLLAGSLLLALAALPMANVERRAFWLLLAALACCLAGSSLLTWQRRVLAFRADNQAVQWLGRERVCQGLHLLAERGRAQRMPVLGEPSLTERIARVCGTPVTSKDKHLTLVS